MKKNTIKLILITLIICFTSSYFKSFVAVYAQSEIEVSSKSAYLIDAESETAIFAKNENERLPIASMTKIMLLLLAFENEQNGNLNFDEQITVSENASGMGGSQVFLETNGIYRVSDLIKSIVVASANDASVAIAEKLYGSETLAVNKMNEKALELGLKNTLFSNCTGLMQATQYSSAKDVAIMLKNLCRYEKYFTFSQIYLDEIEHSGNRKTQLTNTNKLVKFYNGCDGGKTGFTNEAGYCLACTAKRGSMRLISVVIKEPDSKTRFKDCTVMLDYGFNNFSAKTVLSCDTDLDLKVQVLNAKEDWVFIRPQNDFNVFGKKNTQENITIDFEPKNKLFAPLKKGDVVGKLIVYKDSVKIGEVNAVSSIDVEKMTYWDYVKNLAI